MKPQHGREGRETLSRTQETQHPSQSFFKKNRKTARKQTSPPPHPSTDQPPNLQPPNLQPPTRHPMHYAIHLTPHSSAFAQCTSEAAAPEASRLRLMPSADLLAVVESASPETDTPVSTQQKPGVYGLNAYIRQLESLAVPTPEEKQQVAARFLEARDAFQNWLQGSGLFAELCIRLLEAGLPDLKRSKSGAGARANLAKLRAAAATAAAQAPSGDTPAGGAFDEAIQSLRRVYVEIGLKAGFYSDLFPQWLEACATPDAAARNWMSNGAHAEFRAQAGRLHSKLIDARDKIVHGHLRLVIAIAKSYDWSGVPLLDLIQEGNLSLLKAASSYDPERAAFSTFVYPRVQSDIQRAVDTKLGRVVNLPVHICEKLRKLRRVEADLKKDLKRDPTLLELSDATGLSPDVLQELRMQSQRTLHLEEPLGPDADMCLLDQLELEPATDPAQSAHTAELQDQLRTLCPLLPEMQRRVLELRLGLAGPDFTSSEEAAELLGLRLNEVRALESQALESLARIRASFAEAA